MRFCSFSPLFGEPDRFDAGRSVADRELAWGTVGRVCGSLQFVFPEAGIASGNLSVATASIADATPNPARRAWLWSGLLWLGFILGPALGDGRPL